jgi:hypothetical protein
MVKRLLILGAMLCFASSAKAGVVVALEGNGPVGNNWTYDVTLERGSVLTTAGFFVLYDIPGLTSGPIWTPNTADGVPGVSNWLISQPLSGPVPPNLLPNDTPGIPNVEVEYTGLDSISPRALPDDPQGLLLGKLTLTTPITAQGFIDYTSQGAGGLRVVGSVAGPIPEPSSIGMMGVGLATVLAVALRRRRRTH